MFNAEIKKNIEAELAEQFALAKPSQVNIAAAAMLDELPQILERAGLKIVPLEPSEVMVDAAVLAFKQGLSPRNIVCDAIAAAGPAL